MYKEYVVKYGTGAMITANENCFLVGGIHLWWERNKNLVAGSLLGKIFPGGGMRKLLAAGGDSSNSPSRDNHVTEYPDIKICFLKTTLNTKLDGCLSLPF